ncbi:MAG: YidC/Oxa1 family membrane protein insertase [Dehalococcoidia bacterium]
MTELWHGLLNVVEEVLRFFHTFMSPLFGDQAAWGWAIILLTITVRVLMLPLAVKQTRSQRAMQRLQPEMKKIQTKYKVDRSQMRTNPDKYRDQRQKQQEAMMALYKEHGVNPAAGCLPLLPQLPVFFALFSVLRGGSVQELKTASFYIVDSLAAFPGGIESWGAWVLVALMGLTTFYSSRQMMASTASTGPQAQQMKIMMYAMPALLVVFARSMPVGVLLYWVTTNVWTIAQQAVMFRDVRRDPAAATAGAPAAAPAKPKPQSAAKAQGSTRGGKANKA